MQHPGVYIASFGKDYKDIAEMCGTDPWETRLFLLGAMDLEDEEMAEVAAYVGADKIGEVQKSWTEAVEEQYKLIREADTLAREASKILDKRHEVIQKMKSLHPHKTLILSEAEFREDPGLICRASQYVRVEVCDAKGKVLAGSGGHFKDLDSDFDWNYTTGSYPHTWEDEECE